MTSLDLSRLTRSDAVAALRSYPRRFRAAVLPTDDPEVAELADQIGPDGHSALDHSVALTNTFVLLGQALNTALAGSGAAVHGAVTDRSQREWATPARVTVAEALGRLDDEAHALADRIERVEPPAWDREVAVAGGGKIPAFDLVREAVSAGSEHVRAATAAIEAARRRR